MNSMGNADTRATTDSAAAVRTRTWTIASAIALGWALLTLLILHVVSSFDPLLDPLSRYAFTDRGTGLFELSLFSFGIGVVTVLGALTSSGLTNGHTTPLLAGFGAAGLFTAGLFPASFDSDIDPVSGRIHQYASLLSFLCLPAITWSVLDQMRRFPGLARVRTAVIRVLWLGVGALALFGISYIGDHHASAPVLSTLSTLLPIGVTQRIAFLADLCMLVALLVLANRGVRRYPSEAG